MVKLLHTEEGSSTVKLLAFTALYGLSTRVPLRAPVI